MFTCIVFFTLFAHCFSVSVYEGEDDEVSFVDRKDLKAGQGRVLTGNTCEYIYLCNITDNAGCVDGKKFVVKQANNTNKKLLLLDGEAVLAFVTKGDKFTDCPSYTDVTDNVDCKVVDGAANITLSRSAIEGIALEKENYLEIPVVNIENMKVNKRVAKGRQLTGASCEYIYMCNITDNSGCEDGSKMTIKPADGTRKQFLLLNSEPVLAFVADGTKFVNCTAYTEVTTQVDCKVVSDYADLDPEADGRILETSKEGKILVVDTEDGTEQWLDSENVHF